MPREALVIFSLSLCAYVLLIPAVLSRPLLIGAPGTAKVRSPDQLAQLLAGRFRVRELEAVTPPLQRAAPITLELASCVLGSVGLFSVRGSALTMEVDPCLPLCMLALPSHGWGRYQLDSDSIDNVAGQSIAFLPARQWRLINDMTGGTSVQFVEDSLLEVMRSICAGLEIERFRHSLQTPLVFDTADRRVSKYYQHLLGALQLVDRCVRTTNAGPDPLLRLDDLILRCVALLLFPSLESVDDLQAPRYTRRVIQVAVHELMDWMRANLGESISLTEMEARAGYGRRALQLGFKAEVGCGPMQWLRKQRLLHAHHQLTHPTPDTTVSSVAMACGYINLASFSRDFSNRFGVAASVLLRRKRQAIEPAP